MENVSSDYNYFVISSIIYPYFTKGKVMDLLQEYKELYNHEMAFCDRLNGKISNALAIITIIGTGEAIVWKDCLNDGFNIILFVLCIISLQCFYIHYIDFIKHILIINMVIIRSKKQKILLNLHNGGYGKEKK